MQDPLCSPLSELVESRGPRVPNGSNAGKGGAGRGSRDLCLLWGAVEALGLGLGDDIIRFHKFFSRCALQKVWYRVFPAEHPLAPPSLRMIQWLEP